MKSAVLTIEEAIKGITSGMRIRKMSGDVNRVSICKNGVRGVINKSGAILVSSELSVMIMEKENEVSEFMTNLFPEDFKGLYVASTNKLNNPATPDSKKKYYKN